MRERLIGIDAGGTMTKVAVFDLQGRELGCENRPNKMLFPGPGRTERDPDAMWQATCEAIRLVLDRTGTRPEDVAVITPSGFGAGIFLVDAAGAVVRPGFVSTDSRSLSVIADWHARGLKGQVEPLTQAEIWPGQTLAILGWLDRHEPETIARTHRVLGCKDFLRLRLTGTMSTDATDAGCAGLIDTRTSSYSSEALGLLGLSAIAPKLPEIRPSASIVGHVTEAAARLTGLKAGTPVANGVYDVVACSIASGLASPDQLGIVAGTFSINSTLHRQPTVDPLPTLQSPYPLDDLFIATIATPRSASNLEWFVKTLLSAEADRVRAEGKSIYDHLGSLVAERLDRKSRMIFFPFLFGGPNGATGSLIGAEAGHDLGDVARAVFEGIVFAHRTDVDQLLDGREAAKPTSIRLAGGPARNDVWSQMFSDALAMPLQIASGSEFGAKGTAMCGAVAAGLFADLPAAIAAMVKVDRHFEPRPDHTARLDSGYRRYRNACARLSDIDADPGPPSASQSPVRSVA
ncbi:FGGY-family carbohydrate kinase [Jiella sonneratiae]|uniref:Carbohydrate kinase n=1 Tax=Jiella sonneratiae TaxID=2816856 RepID=A0ABS3J9V4_9HYPH|nr:FGGY-family carbohydrate kinase [Jiella sonneratiae]MBO0906466.1 carbohydrate kinase [Jiella sonneratiae]